jgi:hypothetical protein
MKITFAGLEIAAAAAIALAPLVATSGEEAHAYPGAIR